MNFSIKFEWKVISILSDPQRFQVKFTFSASKIVIFIEIIRNLTEIQVSRRATSFGLREFAVRHGEMNSVKLLVRENMVFNKRRKHLKNLLLKCLA